MKSFLISAAALLAVAIAASPVFAEQPKQGGSAVITFNNDLTTLDPQVGYDWQNWSVIKSIFDGLMDYKPGSTELEPDLAQSYTVSDDGLTYIFVLRDGISSTMAGRSPQPMSNIRSSVPSRRLPKAPAAAISVPLPAMTISLAARPPNSPGSRHPTTRQSRSRSPAPMPPSCI